MHRARPRDACLRAPWQAVVKGAGPLADGRRVLEMLVPLCAKAAMKAGLLELKAASTLSRFLHKLVHR